MEEFELTDAEKASALWARLRGYFQAQLEVQRAKNDNPQLDAAQTGAMRGHIACLKGIIALGDDRPQTS